MENIKLDFLPFTIYNSYKKTIKEIQSFKIIKLLDNCNVQINVKKNLFNKCFLYIDILNNDYDSINNYFLNKYKEPKFIWNPFIKVWQEQNIYIIHYYEEKKDKTYDHNLIITFKNPKMGISYNFYKDTKEVIEKISNDWVIRKNEIKYDSAKQRIFCDLYTNKYIYFLVISKNKIIIDTTKYEINEDEEIIMVDNWSVSRKYRETKEIDDIVSSYFEMVMQDDECLNHKFILKVKLKYYNDKKKYISFYDKYIKTGNTDYKIGDIIEYEYNDTKDEYINAKAVLYYPVKGFEEKSINKHFSVCFKNKIIGEGYIEEIL